MTTPRTGSPIVLLLLVLAAPGLRAQNLADVVEAGADHACAVDSNGAATCWGKGSAGYIGDGKADIIWENVDGSIAIWIMNGTAMTSGAGVLGAGTGWSVSGASQ